MLGLPRRGRDLDVPIRDAEAPVRLFTSHWRSALLADADAQMVSISRGEPRRRLPFSYRRLCSLAPNDEAWRQEDREGFDRAYLDQLEALGAERILGDLERVGAGRPCVMLCWEKPADDYCHRWALAAFIEREAGITVPELGPGDLPQREGVDQRSLF